VRGGYVCDVANQHRKAREHALDLLGRPNCSTVFRQGSLCDEIMKAANDLQADLMLIGKWFERIAYGSGVDAPCPEAGLPDLSGA
jgi:hypothetical protein